MHRSRLSTFVIDCRTQDTGAAAKFWSDALGRRVKDTVDEPGYLELETRESEPILLVQRVDHESRIHLDIEADDLESMSIYSAGFPAEYGRKMGGVVELNTHRRDDTGLHGNLVISGGSYDTLSGYGQLDETRKMDAFTASASGSHTIHYLNPVVPENYTNTGTITDFAATYERDLHHDSRLNLSGRRESSRFEIPNELVQQQAGQVQNGDNFETVGIARFQEILSGDKLISFAGMLRQNPNDLESNRNPTPIAVFQHNRFNEGYFKGTFALHRGRHEVKAGLEADTTFLHENFRYAITDATQFDPGTSGSLMFTDRRPDLEQSVFIEDLVRMNNWTASLGLRFDHYQLLLNRNATSPRIAVGRSFPHKELVLHASYDRVFQTPSFENILISSSSQVKALSSNFLRLPVQPSLGNEWEIGATEDIAKRARLDITTYWRGARNAADDDQLLNTGVSYPIAFDRSGTYGVEGKLHVVAAGPVSGFLSYSYMVGNAWFPVTGGLFLGEDVRSAVGQLSGHFPDSQDQRNTADTQFTYKLAARAWCGAGASYGSGLPFDFGGTQADALAKYGSQVVSRLNFDRGRIRPVFAVTVSVGGDLVKHDRVQSSLRVDVENLNNRLNVLDFNGLFSGNAIAPARSFLLRWDTRF